MISRRLLALGLVFALLATGCSGDEQSDAAAGKTAETSAVDALVQTGLTQLESGDTARATTTFENVLSLEPGNVYAHYNLGLIAQEAGDISEAAAQYDAALAADPDFTSALYNRAMLHESGDLEEAVALYRRAIEVDPELAASHMRLGFALVELGETAEAEEHLATGVRLDPAMADVEAPSYD